MMANDTLVTVRLSGTNTATWCVQSVPVGPTARLASSHSSDVTLRMWAMPPPPSGFTVAPVSNHLNAGSALLR
jgi:hypothetical protein